MGAKDPPHPALKAALEGLRALHQDPKTRRLLNEVARLYHEGFPGAPKGVVPLSAVYAAMAREQAGPPALWDFTTLGALIHALGLWRLTKGAYLLDPDLAREVAATPVGRLPVALLFRLPEPAPLVLLPQGLPAWPELSGFHAHLEWDPGGRPGVEPHLELRFLAYLKGERGYHPATLVLDLDAPDLEEAVAKTLSRSVREGRGAAAQALLEARPLLEREYGRILAQLLSLTLYLCQEEPDLGGARPRPPAPVRVRKGRVLVEPPLEALLVPTGWRWGKALRLAREAREKREGGPTGRAVAPHVRRAHWHLYWTGEGARKDPSRAVPRLVWVPATLVGRKRLLEAGLSEEELPATLRRVRTKERGG